MEKVKSAVNQGIFSDTLAGKILSEGDVIHLKWADGSETENVVHIAEQMVGTHVTRKAYVEVEHRGSRVIVPLTGHQAERKTFREHVQKQQAKFDAAVEAVVQKVIAQAKTSKRKRKSKKTKRVRN